MSYDIYGNPLRRGHCEVHPHVHQEYPCDLCLSQHSPKQREPDWPMCGICGEHEACADSCGVAVCSEACDHEARRRHNESETLRARIAGLEAELAAALADAERYRVARAKVCIVGDAFHVINLRPTYVAPDAAIEFDAAIDAARGGEG